jgi:hypothetical protein
MMKIYSSISPLPCGFILASGTPVVCYMLFVDDTQHVWVVKDKGGVISQSDKTNII